MDFEKEIIIIAMNHLKKYNLTKIYCDHESFDKNINTSVSARQNGNKLFGKKNHEDEKAHEEIWKMYTRSIAFAPTRSEELAVALANRSVLLLHLKKYKDALLDIERALKITHSSSLKVKLFCRQTECFVALQAGKQSSSFEKAKYWLNKLEDNCESLKLNKMIEKAQQTIEHNVPNCPQKEKKIELTCKNDAVAISYDKKFGRGLVATRNIKPGELLYIEKFYVVSASKSKFYAYCSYCLRISWTLIPCDDCAYYLYCSEKCKTEAWQKYHDIECRMKSITFYDDILSNYIEFSIRALIMGIKEAGSIKNLRNMINEIDNSDDKKTKGLLENKEFLSNSFKSLYSLKSSKNIEKVKVASLVAIASTQSLATCTDFFESKFECNSNNLEQNEDAVFISCLLLKLMSTFHLNAYSVQCMSKNCDSENFSTCFQSLCCSRGFSLSLMTSLINHSCDNNVNKFYTNDGKVIYYAIKPITTNSQIFSSYYFDYTITEKDSRQAMLFSLFEFHCDCIACQKDWPTLRTICEKDKFTECKCSAEYNELTKIMEKCQPLIIKCLKHKYHHYSRKEIQSLAKSITKLDAQKIQKPNVITASLKVALTYMMEKRYFKVLKVPNSCHSKEN